MGISYNKLWKLLIDKKLKKKFLLEEAGLSRSTLTHMNHEEHVSTLCTNPDDGITYKILLNDLRISRYAESGTIRVGENVQITYEGEIDESNIIDSAISASDVVISGGDVLIPE